MTYTFACDVTRVSDGWFRASAEGQSYDAPTPLRAVSGLLTKLDGLGIPLPPSAPETRGAAIESAVHVVTFSPAELLRG